LYSIDFAGNRSARGRPSGQNDETPTERKRYASAIVMLALLRLVEMANAMKILRRRRPLDRIEQGWLRPMSQSFRFGLLALRL
jgi:hypothetical protein